MRHAASQVLRRVGERKGGTLYLEKLRMGGRVAVVTEEMTVLSRVRRCDHKRSCKPCTTSSREKSSLANALEPTNRRS